MASRKSNSIRDLWYNTQYGPDKNNNYSTLKNRELCSIFCSKVNGKRIWKRINTCVCITESLCCTPETNITLLINYKIKQKSFKTFKKNKQNCSTYRKIEEIKSYVWFFKSNPSQLQSLYQEVLIGENSPPYTRLCAQSLWGLWKELQSKTQELTAHAWPCT